jgi:hypothetical protein
MIISPPLSTHKQTSAIRIALLILMAIIVVPLTLVAYNDTEPHPIALAVAGAIVVATIAACVAIGKTVLTIHQEGVRRVSVFGVKEIEWKDVREYRYRVVPIQTGGGLAGVLVMAVARRGSSRGMNLDFTLISNDDRKVKISSNFRDADQAIGKILGAIHPAIQKRVDEQLDAGGAVFGNVRLSRRTLQWKEKEPFPLSEITRAELNGQKLSIRRKDKLFDAVSTPSHKVPNVLLLLETMEKLGVAKSGVPTVDPLARVR